MAANGRVLGLTQRLRCVCDPRSPWQRGTNENTNGLLRDYFPKGTDFKPITQARLGAVAAELSGRPRQTLGWVPPSAKFAEAVALTTRGGRAGLTDFPD